MTCSNHIFDQRIYIKSRAMDESSLIYRFDDLFILLVNDSKRSILELQISLSTFFKSFADCYLNCFP